MELRHRAGPKALASEQNPGRRSNARATRFMATFAVSLLAAFGLLFTPLGQAIDTKFSGVLVGISHSLIVSCGGKALTEGAILRTQPGGFGIQMQDGCNGVNVTILLCSAILAFPSSWGKKLVGLIAGSVIIQGLNLVRFVSLFYLGQYSMAWFDFAHGYLWESLLILDTLVIFAVWASRISRSEARANAGS